MAASFRKVSWAPFGTAYDWDLLDSPHASAQARAPHPLAGAGLGVGELDASAANASVRADSVADLSMADEAGAEPVTEQTATHADESSPAAPATNGSPSAAVSVASDDSMRATMHPVGDLSETGPVDDLAAFVSDAVADTGTTTTLDGGAAAPDIAGADGANFPLGEEVDIGNDTPVPLPTPEDPDGDITPDNGAGTGTVAVGASGDQKIDGLLAGDRWSGSITYTDPDAAGDYQLLYYSDQDGDLVSAQNEGFSQVDAAQLLAVHGALNSSIYTQPAGSAGLSVEGFTNLTITYGTSGAGTGTIRVANTSDAPTSYAFYPDGGWYGGDAWFGPSARSGVRPTTGDYGWHTHIHELGHALGLKHGQETWGFGALPSSWDSMEFSVMTYRSYVGHPMGGYTNETYGYAQTWMMLDIAALQYMYGADYSTNSGNTTYTWSPTAGETYVNGTLAIDPGANRIFATIWDGGGVDTYDLSNYTTDMTIDLTPGAWSTFSTAQLADLDAGTAGRLARGNIANALLYNGNQASMIENATGGSGADTIYGNVIGNVLRGNGGNDTMRGSEWGVQASDGSDTMYGGDGNDFMGGHAGNDWMYGDAGNDSVIGDAGNDYAFGGAGNDWVVGDYTDASGNGNDYLTGGDGFDTLEGGTGNDTVYGDNDDDWLYGQDGDDYMSGDAGNDRVYGGNGNDTLYGGTGNDSIYGEAGIATVYGQDGNDYIVDGSFGTGDSFDGGAGTDTLVSDTTWVDSVVFDLAAGWMKYPGTTGTTYDTILNIENLTVGGGADVYGSDVANLIVVLDTGPASNNTIDGRGGNDTVYAGIGDDSLMGGAGTDYLYGQDGNDTLAGGLDVDYAYGGNGDDLIVFTLWNYFDHVDGGAGTDTLDASASDYSGNTFDFEAGTLTGTTPGTLSLLGIEIFQDGSGGNTIVSNGTGGTYFGNGGDDTMIAELGAETMDGGVGGNDTLDLTRYTGDYVVDMTTGATNFWYELYTNFEHLVSGDGNDSITGTSGANSISTGAGNDSINAGAGMDTVNAGDGDDIITDTQGMGASDDDVYDGGAGTDTLVHDLGWASSVTFDLDTGWSSWSGNRDQLISIENLTVGGAATVIGSAVANVLTVNGTGANVIDGLAGNDTIDAGGGNDGINAGSGMDVVNAGDGDDVITDTETMTASDNDVYDGGAGNDTLVHDIGWNSSVAFNLDTGWATVSGGNRDQLISIENLTVGGYATVIGSAVANMLTVNGTGDNVIDGLAGNDTIDAGGGNDSINAGAGMDAVNAGDGDDVITDTETMLASENDVYDGGAGNDTLVHDIGWNSSVAFNLDTGWATVSGGNRDQLISIENLTVGGAATVIGSAVANVLRVNGSGANSIDGLGGNDTIYAGGGDDSVDGGSGDDVIYGEDGADQIDGGTGADTMTGGDGNDTYTVDDAGDQVVEVDSVPGGIDTVGSSISYTLGTGLENLTLTGAANLNGTGNALDNTIAGNSGDNVLNGQAGNDSLSGDAGIDTLLGGDGNDSLDGGAGDDSMVGGAGDDSFFVDSATDLIKELSGGGTDDVYSTAASFVLANQLENLYLVGAGNQSGKGNSLANLIFGNAFDNLLEGVGGADTLHGGAGNDSLNGGNGADRLIGDGGIDTLNGAGGIDTMEGGIDDDTYKVNVSSDVIVELAGEGIDVVDSTAATFTLPDHVEHLNNRLTTGTQTGRGNGLDNTITGLGADDNLVGLDGNDSLAGNVGNDTLSGGNGNDTLLGGIGNDSLAGAAGDDSLVGGDGNDTLNGGSNADILKGGAGDDDYVGVGTGDSLTESAGAGYDRVFSNISFTLPGNFEYLELTGSGNDGTGNGLDNVLVGNGNANVLSGLAGADTLDGRAGNDSLYAGVDAVEDRFVFGTALDAATNVDTLYDAQFAEDQIMLANSIFTELLSTGGTNTGTLGAGYYFEGAGFDGNDVSAGIGVWYDLSTGALYYNPTSGVGGDSLRFAYIDGAPAALSSTDFTLYGPPLYASAGSYAMDDGLEDGSTAAPPEAEPSGYGMGSPLVIG